MANTTIKISQLPNIGLNLNSNTLLPVVSTNGTFTTDKVTVGNVANFILTEAGNLLPEAFVSTIAYSVANSAQPNITSVGNLTGLRLNSLSTFHIPGGTNGYFLQTDGNGNLNWSAAGGGGNGSPGGSNTQVQFNDSGVFGGESTFTYNKNTNTLSVSNVSVTSNLTSNIVNATYLYGDGSNISNVSVEAGTYLENGNSNVFVVTDGNVGFTVSGVSNVLVVTSNSAILDGNLEVNGNISATNIGNIAAINLDGNVSNVLTGTGTWVPFGGTTIGNITFNGSVISTNQDANIVIQNSNNSVYIGSNVYSALIWEPDGTNINFSQDNGSFVWVEQSGAYIWTYDNANTTAYQWQFDNYGNLISPANNTTQTSTNGSITTINGNPYPSTSDSNTSTTIYTASNSDVIGAELSIRIQATNFTELVDLYIAKESVSANVTYSIYGRLKTNDNVSDTTMNVDLDIDNKIIVLANCHAVGPIYYTYDVKEFKAT